jgi:hypothetical protein
VYSFQNLTPQKLYRSHFSRNLEGRKGGGKGCRRKRGARKPQEAQVGRDQKKSLPRLGALAPEKSGRKGSSKTFLALGSSSAKQPPPPVLKRLLPKEAGNLSQKLNSSTAGWGE